MADTGALQQAQDNGNIEIGFSPDVLRQIAEAEAARGGKSGEGAEKAVGEISGQMVRAAAVWCRQMLFFAKRLGRLCEQLLCRAVAVVCRCLVVRLEQVVELCAVAVLSEYVLRYGQLQVRPSLYLSGTAPLAKTLRAIICAVVQAKIAESAQRLAESVDDKQSAVPGFPSSFAAAWRFSSEEVQAGAGYMLNISGVQILLVCLSLWWTTPGELATSSLPLHPHGGSALPGLHCGSMHE